MKKILILCVLALLASENAFSWGRLGHATIAKIAEDHLTSSAKKKISEYLDGHSIVEYASYADEQKSNIRVDIGFDPVKGKRVISYPHTFYADLEGNPYRDINMNGEYVKNCIYFIEKLADELRENHKNMDPQERFNAIVFIVHFVGDMHCPEHMRFPDDMTIGKYPITFAGEKMSYHKLWDTDIITSVNPWSFTDMAYICDIYSKKQIKEITAGGPYDWGKDSAVSSRHVHQVKEGADLKRSFAIEHQPLVKSQLAKAGYRLAALLNDIF